ncbi:integrin beta-8 [Pelobates fuscus]|uniref:integrin beta-8 n=1 Tax=Pelobates fuscus TaxID=191477 RepID=UPI002FE4D847
MLSTATVPNSAASVSYPGILAPCSLRAIWLLSLLLGLCQSAENRCFSSNAATCTKCLALGPECGWCSQEDFMVESANNERCDTVSNLKAKRCRPDLIEHPSVQVQVLSSKEPGSQVIPSDVNVQLRPGATANFMVRVHRLEKYPVDLYYLVDVSVSMRKSIGKLISMGFDLSRKMANFSNDIRFGFGSFVDKPVTPYISIHPSRIKNQCAIFNVHCMPAHGYINVLPLTDNITEFKKLVSQQEMSGNLDDPECAFDAMLQAAVCHKDVGWRKEAKRLLIVMTDETSHLALDSKLAGIVLPNDGNCHIKDNVYIRSTDMEHPSLGLLGEKLVENNVLGIFAVQGKHYHWYKDLTPLLPGTIAKELEPTASNVKDLVVDAYQRLLSEVKLQVDNPLRGINVNITAICPDGSRHSGTEGCRNVRSNEKVLFNVTITMDMCDIVEGHNHITLKPIGFNETVNIKIHKACTCLCNSVSKTKGKCVTEVLLDCQTALCNEDSCTLDETDPPTSCRKSPSQPLCNGRGVCSCGKCICHESKLGKIYGKYCEMDDFSCPYHYGKLCSGNGECEDGNCKCFSGWDGNRCHCTTSKKHCMDSNGQICSGRGNCVCGKCECINNVSFGHLCEYCLKCGNGCTNNWNYEHSYETSNVSEAARIQCKSKCSTLGYSLNQTTECLLDPRILKFFIIILVVTFFFGLITVLITRQMFLQCQNIKDTASSSDYRGARAKKDKGVLHRVYGRTVSYNSEKPEDIHIGILGVHEPYKYKF